MPGMACPPVGPMGDGSPPSPVLCAAKTAALSISGRCARRSLPDTLPASARSWSPLRAHDQVEAPDHARAFGRPVPQSGHVVKEIGGSPTFPSSPCGDMPRSQTPVVSCPLALARAGLLPSGPWKPSAFLSVYFGEISLCPRLYALRGSITRPASSLPPAPYVHCWVCTWSVLLTGWRGVGQGGLEPSVLTYWVPTTHFMGFRPVPRFRAYLGTTTAWLARPLPEE